MYDPIRGYPTVAPYVLYRDPLAATRWLCEVLGFHEAIRFTVPNGGPVGHVELERDGAVIILGLAGTRSGKLRRSPWCSLMMSPRPAPGR